MFLLQYVDSLVYIVKKRCSLPEGGGWCLGSTKMECVQYVIMLAFLIFPPPLLPRFCSKQKPEKKAGTRADICLWIGYKSVEKQIFLRILS